MNRERFFPLQDRAFPGYSISEKGTIKNQFGRIIKPIDGKITLINERHEFKIISEVKKDINYNIPIHMAIISILIVSYKMMKIFI